MEQNIHLLRKVRTGNYMVIHLIQILELLDL